MSERYGQEYQRDDMRNDIVTDEFTKALRDYAYLLNRAYPRKSILKIVGDRYLLNAFQRVMLSRGVFPDSDARVRIGKTRKTRKSSVPGSWIEMHVSAILSCHGNIDSTGIYAVSTKSLRIQADGLH